MARRRHSTALGLAAIAGLAVASAGTAHGAPAIPLNTGQETPAPTSRGAHGSFSYDIDGQEVCYTLKATRLSTPAVAAHIHLAPRNLAGPVVVPLQVDNATSFEVSTCTTADPELLAQIQEDPRSYYVNVHTAANPAGEIRGQLK